MREQVWLSRFAGLVQRTALVRIVPAEGGTAVSAWFDPDIQPRDWWRALTGRESAWSAAQSQGGAECDLTLVTPSPRPVSALRLLRVTADGRPVYEDAA